MIKVLKGSPDALNELSRKYIAFRQDCLQRRFNRLQGGPWTDQVELKGRQLPLHSRIEAWNTHPTVRKLSGNLHLPYRLWGRRLRDLENRRITAGSRRTFVILHVPFFEHLVIASKEKIELCGWMESQRCRLRRFVDLQ